MLESKISRMRFCLVVFSLIVPVIIPAQQLPPSVMLDIDVNEQDQVGAIVRTLQPGPNVGDLQAFFSRRMLIPWALALLARRRPTTTMEPVFDPAEFPNGPMRMRLAFPPVCIPAGVPFTPGFVGFVVPVRLGQTLTPESFLQSFLADYVIEVNGVKFMDSDLFTPEHVTASAPMDGALFGLRGVRVQFWGLNVTQKITRPGTYIIRNYLRIPKTIPLPELSTIFPALGELPAGQIVLQVTVNIQPSC
ncbi:MAG: hypothetical protein HY314_07760 [Acidobacteria bacterium]|nr:hypothetical protein [Acidobacteriota bacterium]